MADKTIYTRGAIKDATPSGVAYQVNPDGTVSIGSAVIGAKGFEQLIGEVQADKNWLKAVAPEEATKPVAHLI